jgi:pimeloyl-ACP methyl ester carboxylesterase
MELAVHDFGGEGPDLLLLHGGGDNLETWRDFADAPDHVASRIRDFA